MAWVEAAVAVLVIGGVLSDAFEVVILPRRVRHSYRLARFYYRVAWAVWRAAARLLPGGWPRFGFLSAFGPLSLFGLLSVWAVGLIAGFALLHSALGTALSLPPATIRNAITYLYFSGTTFFTLGYGDVVPMGTLGRMISVGEAGIGFGFLAIVLSYVPVLYQTFSRREITISLLDARAGSPPTASEMLRRLTVGRSCASARPLLVEWEHWAAELLESHVSFPVLRFYRSQHDNQSWVAALTTILDTSAFLIATSQDSSDHQARLTFAMARHAAVDLGLVSQTAPLPPHSDRLPEADLVRLIALLREAGMELHEGPAAIVALKELRELYEPFVHALADYLQFTLPPFMAATPTVDNWQTSPWTQRSPGLGGLPTARAASEHFH